MRKGLLAVELSQIPRHLPALCRINDLALAHAGRRRTIADGYRSRILLSAACARAMFLVDGFVPGV